MISMVTRGYSGKIRVLLCRSLLTFDVPITSSGALRLSYGKLEGARPFK